MPITNTTGSTPAPAAQHNAGQTQLDTRTHESGFKEYVAALLSIAIVGFTIYCMLKMFKAPENISDTLWQHQSTILQVAIGLAGTVTGYYFGRIPAERAAANAQQTANNAQQTVASATSLAERTSSEATRIRTQVNEVLKTVRTPTGGGGVRGLEGDVRVDIAQRLEDILRG
jgi:hypothetical protein